MSDDRVLKEYYNWKKESYSATVDEWENWASRAVRFIEILKRELKNSDRLYLEAIRKSKA